MAESRPDYSRRVNWPGPPNLDPRPRFSDPTTATAGNPFLRPEFSDSYEAKLQFRASRQNIDLVLYSRRASNIWSDLSVLDANGVLVARPFNLGRQTLNGASFNVRGPLGGGIRYVLTGNLADQDIQIENVDPALVRTGLAYGGSLQLEYRDGTEGRRGADRVVVSGRYSGPIEGGLYRSSDYFRINASWSHAFTDRITGVLSVNDLIGPPTVRRLNFSLNGESIERTQAAGPRVTLSLTYSLGAPSN